MQYSRPRIICNGAPPEGEKTPTTYVGAGSLTDAELERLILRETKALKATDTQETEEPRVGVADAVELQPSAPSPNTVPPPISTSRSGTATPTSFRPSPAPQPLNHVEARNSKQSFDRNARPGDWWDAA